MKKRVSKTAKSKKSKEFFEIRLPRLSKDILSLTNFLAVALLVFAILLGWLSYKVVLLEKDLKASIVANAPAPVPTEDTTPKKVSVDKDPVLGEKNAKVTIIEFSDYECPFCKKYFDDTYEQIKKEYVEKGLVKIVFRDLPLSFHANAHKQAEAAECAREQGGDSVYFKYHDEIFKRTTSNGTGLALDQLSVIANELGLNGTELQACIDSDKYKEEVDRDIADANSVSASGTPTFFIGKSSSSGTILGTKLVGAQPFSEFQTVIEQELKK